MPWIAGPKSAGLRNWAIARVGFRVNTRSAMESSKATPLVRSACLGARTSLSASGSPTQSRKFCAVTTTRRYPLMTPKQQGCPVSWRPTSATIQRSNQQSRSMDRYFKSVPKDLHEPWLYGRARPAGPPPNRTTPRHRSRNEIKANALREWGATIVNSSRQSIAAAPACANRPRRAQYVT